MDVLGSLESRVDQLLALLDSTKSDNLRLGDELAAVRRENIKLTQENVALRQALVKEEGRRKAVRERLVGLLRTIRNYGIGVRTHES